MSGGGGVGGLGGVGHLDSSCREVNAKSIGLVMLSFVIPRRFAMSRFHCKQVLNCNKTGPLFLEFN